ncbi:MAG TPA: LytTR family DNA-binding domain-containing protein, partial [Cellvibrionaceae bacterium]
VASAEAARQAIEVHDPDVVLLDIQMPGEDGLSAARSLEALDDPPAIIFCTAYDQYALEAFATVATGYLLKPIKREQLAEVLCKVSRLNKVQRAAVARETQTETETKSHLTAKTHRGIELIALQDVRYFLADQKYVTVYHTGGEHLLDAPLKELEQEFAGRFLRVHRNALVSVAHIQALERSAEGGYRVRLADTEAMPIVSRRHAMQVKEVLHKL